MCVLFGIHKGICGASAERIRAASHHHDPSDRAAAPIHAISIRDATDSSAARRTRAERYISKWRANDFARWLDAMHEALAMKREKKSSILYGESFVRFESFAHSAGRNECILVQH